MSEDTTAFTMSSAKRIAAAVIRDEARPDNPTRAYRPRAVPNVSGPEGVTNTTASAVPAVGAVLHITNSDTDWLHEFESYSYPGHSDFAIAADEIAANGDGLAWFDGVCYVLCLNYLSLNPGDRLAPSTTAWYADIWPAGPLRVIGPVVSQDQPSGLVANAGLVWAQITRERTGYTYVTDSSGSPHGPAATIVIAGGLVKFDNAGNGIAQLSWNDAFGSLVDVVQLPQPTSIIVELAAGGYTGMVAHQLRGDGTIPISHDSQGIVTLDM
jgi:hypothetical protein